MCHHHVDDPDWIEEHEDDDPTGPAFLADDDPDEAAADVELDREFEEPETKTPSDD